MFLILDCLDIQNGAGIARHTWVLVNILSLIVKDDMIDADPDQDRQLQLETHATLLGPSQPYVLIHGAGHLPELGIFCQSASDTPELSEDSFLKVMKHC